jgi:hypothetical protein
VDSAVEASTGAPTTPETGTPAPEGVDTQVAAETQDTGTPAGETSAEEHPFSLDAVPEELREHVGRLAKQLQADYTRKTMSLADQRKALQAQIDLEERLANEDTRNEALQELLGRYDLELDLGDEDEDGEEEGEGFDPEALLDDEDLPEEVKYLLEQEKRREEQAEQEAQQKALDGLRTHVSTALEGFREANYPAQDSLPAIVNDTLLGLGMYLPAREDGLPDMEAAATMLEAVEAAAVQRFIDSKKDAPLPATRTGSSGTDKPDLSSDQARLAIANKVAERALRSGI